MTKPKSKKKLGDKIGRHSERQIEMESIQSDASCQADLKNTECYFAFDFSLTRSGNNCSTNVHTPQNFSLENTVLDARRHNIDCTRTFLLTKMDHINETETASFGRIQQPLVILDTLNNILRKRVFHSSNDVKRDRNSMERSKKRRYNRNDDDANMNEKQVKGEPKKMKNSNNDVVNLDGKLARGRKRPKNISNVDLDELEIDERDVKLPRSCTNIDVRSNRSSVSRDSTGFITLPGVNEKQVKREPKKIKNSNNDVANLDGKSARGRGRPRKISNVDLNELEIDERDVNLPRSCTNVDVRSNRSSVSRDSTDFITLPDVKRKQGIVNQSEALKRQSSTKNRSKPKFERKDSKKVKKVRRSQSRKVMNGGDAPLRMQPLIREETVATAHQLRRLSVVIQPLRIPQAFNGFKTILASSSTDSNEEGDVMEDLSIGDATETVSPIDSSNKEFEPELNENIDEKLQKDGDASVKRSDVDQAKTGDNETDKIVNASESILTVKDNEVSESVPTVKENEASESISTDKDNEASESILTDKDSEASESVPTDKDNETSESVLTDKDNKASESVLTDKDEVSDVSEQPNLKENVCCEKEENSRGISNGKEDEINNVRESSDVSSEKNKEDLVPLSNDENKSDCGEQMNLQQKIVECCATTEKDSTKEKEQENTTLSSVSKNQNKTNVEPSGKYTCVNSPFEKDNDEENKINFEESPQSTNAMDSEDCVDKLNTLLDICCPPSNYNGSKVTVEIIKNS